METILRALEGGVLTEFELPETETREALRPLYLAAELVAWVNDTVELYDANRGKAKRTMYEHLLQTLSDFRCATRPLVGDLYRVQPDRHGVWKLHSTGLRIFGWVPAPNAFVAVTAAFTEACHGPNNAVPDLRTAVQAFAKRHGLEKSIKLGDRSVLFPTQAR
jgi:hypothetical protein